jgi:hypothetical protein
MNKLREKLCSALPLFGRIEEQNIEKLEQITDDFTVAFAQWINSDGWELERREQRTYTFTEFLQHFKTNIYGK